MTDRTPRSRGVRLSDLDRSKVYRIAYSGRRWEVLGPEDAPDDGAPAPGDVWAPAGEAERTESAPDRPGARHLARDAGPAATPAREQPNDLG